MTTMYQSSNGYFQQYNVLRHKAQVFPNWFLERDNEIMVLNWPSHTPDLNPTENN